MFTNAFAHSCSMRPSFPSILSSTYPLMYGGYERLKKRTLISEAFKHAGFQTPGFHSNLYLSDDLGYDCGFDEFYDSKTNPSATARLRQSLKFQLDSDGELYRMLSHLSETAECTAGADLGSPYVPADDITNRALEWALQAGKKAGPRFLWVH